MEFEREVYHTVHEGGLFDLLRYEDFEEGRYGLFIIRSFFKDEGWVSYLVRTVDKEELENDIKREFSKRGFRVVAAFTTGSLNFVIVGKMPRNVEAEEFLEEMEGSVVDLILSDEFMGELRRFAEIFENPFKDLFDFSIGFSPLRGGRKSDVESAIQVATKNAKLRKVDKFTKLSLELLRIMESDLFESHFQPIFDIKRNRIFAYEALIRGPKNSPLRNPDLMFRIARYNGLDSQLDTMTRRKHLMRFKELGLKKGLLSINLSPSTPILIDEVFADLKKMGIPKDRIIWEISEKTAVDDYNAFGRFIDLLVREGYKVAVDDFGSSAMTFKLAWAIENHVIKLDKRVIDEMAESEGGLNFLSRVMKCFYRDDGNIVAEGVEDPKTLKLLIESGYHLIQGFVIAKPSPIPISEDELKKKLSDILTMN